MASINLLVFLSSLLYFSIFSLKSFPVKSFEKLISAQKGDKIPQLHEIKTYLTKLGYMGIKYYPIDDIYDDSLLLAIKRYQTFYNLTATGVLDHDTIKIMSHPRCGTPDLYQHNESFCFHSRYAFLPGKPTWSRRNLTYSFAQSVIEDAKVPIAVALAKWSQVTDFVFNPITDYDNADIRIFFQYIDGLEKAVAQSQPPEDGRIQFDTSESWSAFVTPHKLDIQTIALHETGHMLGLDHSKDPNSIMFAYIHYGIRKGFSSDDIAGIRALYNLPN